MNRHWVLIGFLALLSSQTYAQCDAWYRFDGNLSDASGNGYHGRMIGAEGVAATAQFTDGVDPDDFVVQRYNSKKQPSGARAAIDRLSERLQAALEAPSERRHNRPRHDFAALLFLLTDESARRGASVSIISLAASASKSSRLRYDRSHLSTGRNICSRWRRNFAIFWRIAELIHGTEIVG